MSSAENPSMRKSNLSDCKNRFFFIVPSVENIFSLCNTISSVLGSDAESNFILLPSGRITEICKSGEPEYLAVNS